METTNQTEALQAEVARLTSALETERVASRRAEERTARYVRELERSNSELEQFAYAASHDLQEPLRTIAQFGGLLREQLQDRHMEALLDPEVALYLGHLSNGAEKAKKLIDGLLAYSRIGRQAQLVEFPLDEALNDAIDLLNGTIAESGTIVVRTALPVVWGDRQMLSRAFMNLITNAMRFSDEPARVRISAADDGHEVVISVADNGIGIEPRHAERIFGLFQRLNPDRAGTGLGLAICKKVVDIHGGRIWVESMLGRGATFHFTLHKVAPGA